MASANGTVPTLSVYSKQKQGILSMLSACTTAVDPFEDSEDVWKVLIYDVPGRDILAPLLSVSELRSAGVTLHMLLHNVRHPIPDVPAIYFVEPTLQNVERIASDASKGTYASLWINFTACATREVLERLAELVAASSASRANPLNGQISRVYDMYSSFHSLQHNLFSLNLPGCYPKLNATGVSNAQVERLVSDIVDKLFCTLATLGTIPIIRAQKGGPASLVASILDSRLREHLKAGKNAFSESSTAVPNGTTTFNPNINSSSGKGGGAFQASPTDRALLVIIDRSLDLPVMLHHTWTYQALAHDLLGLRLNRVTVSGKDENDANGADPDGTTPTPKPTGTKRTFDLDLTDKFWTEHAGLPFPMVAEAVEGALQSYKNEVAELNRSTGILGDVADLHQLEAKAASNPSDKIAAAVSSIPELAKKKRQIDLHTNIATALLDEIKQRGLDGYFQVEEELLTRPGSFDVERILALLRDNRGTTQDKLRLFLIFYLCVDSASESDVHRCVEALQQVGCTTVSAFTYLKSVRAFTRSMSSTSAPPMSASSSLGGVYAASVLDTLSQVAANVNKLILSSDKALAAARDVHAHMEPTVDSEVAERYVTLDPKTPKGSPPNVGSSGFRNAIVFVVGPGNYIEFQNCQDYVCSKIVQDGSTRRMVPNGKTVIYGATELCTGEEFAEQLGGMEV